MIDMEPVLVMAVVLVAVLAWLIHVMSLIAFEDKIIGLEDQARRMQTDVNALGPVLHDKVDSQTLNRRLSGLAELLGLTPNTKGKKK
jgi:hypothetical protein